MLHAFRIFVVLGCAIIGFQPVPARAERRLALSVGIDVYDNLPADQQLKKAVNDAKAVAGALRELDFTAEVEENVTRLAFSRSWQRFLNRLEPGDTAALFFAGHAVVVGGVNYLLLRDVPQVEPSEEKVLAGASIRFNDLMDDLRDKNVRIALFIVDACRDNPFRDARGRSVGGTRGLMRIEPGKGSFVMYSAGIGERALDRLSAADMEPNSPYTRALLPILKTPGLSMAEIASRVRREVVRLASTAQPPHVQTPAYYDELVGQFLLKAGPAEAKAADGRDDELAGLKAKLDKLQEALTAKQAAPKDSSASEQVTKLMEQISGLEAQVKRLEAARPAAPKGAAPTAGKTAAPSAGRPDPRAHSVSVWPKNSLQLGQTVSTNTPYGKLTCTSRGPGARACRWD